MSLLRPERPTPASPTGSQPTVTSPTGVSPPSGSGPTPASPTGSQPTVTSPTGVSPPSGTGPTPASPTGSQPTVTSPTGVSPPTGTGPTPATPTGSQPSPGATSPPTTEVCEAITVGFDTDASGNAVVKGAYVENEWLAYGFTLSAEGGFGTLPRIFDTASPGGETPKVCGDSDLGAPNAACTPFGGPGKGIGGKPGEPGMNCEPLGNALIVQEPGESCPDDNVDGGIINIVFPATNGQYVYELGLLDIDYETFVEVGYETSTGFPEREIPVPLLGDNSYQVLEINQVKCQVDQGQVREKWSHHIHQIVS